MILHFGLDFDGIVHAGHQPVRTGVLYAGSQKLLHWLEAQFGLSGYPEQTDYLRVELYRQSIAQLLEGAFYAQSYASDRLATASALLDWRDELLLGGWDFVPEPSLPARLLVMAGAEAIFQKKISDPAIGPLAFGKADRFAQVLRAVKSHKLPLSSIELHEPEGLLPPHIMRFIHSAREQQIPIAHAPVTAHAPEHTHLGYLQRCILGNTSQPARDFPANDSICILKAHRDSDAAVWIAQILRKNPGFQPVFLIPELSLTLEQTLVLEGFPSMGILSASLARPSLQVLKLAPAFIWEPVDVFKIMEFVTLPVKPLDDGLSLEIARVMSGKPGLFSDTWFAAVFGYLERGEVPEEAREQYEFWFNRRRYKADGTAPKKDAVGIYAFLHDWAHRYFEKNGRKNASLLVLAEQARRIRDLLEALPEQRLTFLELERIVRTIYDPSPVQMAPAESTAFEYVHNQGALADPVQNLIWWNCLFENTAPKPDKWFPEERQHLALKGIQLSDPARESRLNLWKQQYPVLQTTQRLMLVVPEQANGADTVPSLLLGDIEAAFGSARDFTYRLDNGEDLHRLQTVLALPGQATLAPRIVGRPQPVLMLEHPEYMEESPYETFTNLESLLYYPHRWFFRQKAKLYPASLFSVTADYTLLGSLAHRFFEMLLQEDLTGIDKKGVQDWIDRQAETLLEREGATLLLYGREPERNAFLTRVKNAAWSLISILRTNGWSVLHTELDLEGVFCDIPVRGKADLVLQRGDEMAIVDFKWSGAKRRREMIRNGEDLQLILYAHLLQPGSAWPHTAYFILEEGRMIARNRAAFSDAVLAGRGDETHRDACDRIFDKMEKTFRWRMEQVRNGHIELRTARTAPELEALYEGQLMDLLEMKNEDARWDDYRTLLEFM
jgi:hypothetical protein